MSCIWFGASTLFSEPAEATQT